MYTKIIFNIHLGKSLENFSFKFLDNTTIQRIGNVTNVREERECRLRTKKSFYTSYK